MAADAESGHVARREARLLGDDVHRPAGLAASVQGRGRPLQDLDAVGVRAVAQAVVAAAGIEAVDQVVGTEVRVAREAAHGVAVPQATQVALARNAAGQVEGAGQRGDAGIVEQVARQHTHALRQVLQRGLGLGGAGDRQAAVVLALTRDHDLGSVGQGGERPGGGAAECECGKGRGQGGSANSHGQKKRRQVAPGHSRTGWSGPQYRTLGGRVVRYMAGPAAVSGRCSSCWHRSAVRAGRCSSDRNPTGSSRPGSSRAGRG